MLKTEDTGFLNTCRSKFIHFIIHYRVFRKTCELNDDLYVTLFVNPIPRYTAIFVCLTFLN